MYAIANWFKWLDDHTDQIMKYCGIAVLVILPYAFIALVVKNVLQFTAFNGDTSFANTTWGAVLVLVIAAIVLAALWTFIHRCVRETVDRHFADEDWNSAPMVETVREQNADIGPVDPSDHIEFRRHDDPFSV